MKKHLLMHVWPRCDKPWRLTVAQVAARLNLFDGRRVVAVAGSHDAEPASAVRAMFRGPVEIIECSNDPSLREVASFETLMRMVSEEPGYTFYCHGKGSTHEKDSICQEWGRVMCEVLLDNADLAERALQKYPVVGCFKRARRFGMSPDNWHYSGTFFWIQNSVVFGMDWKRTDRCWFGVEAWPGKMFEEHQACSLFMRDVGDLYMEQYWASVVRPALKAWRRKPATSVDLIPSIYCDFVRIRPGYSQCIKCKRVVHDVRLLRRYVCGDRQRGPQSCEAEHDVLTYLNGEAVMACPLHGACMAGLNDEGVHVCEKLSPVEARVEICKHRRGRVRGVTCEPCGGKTVPVFECRIHNECVAFPVQGADVRACSLCFDYCTSQALNGIMSTHGQV